MTQYVSKVVTKPCPHFDLVERVDMGSLIVDVRLNDSTNLVSSVSTHLLAVESAQTCAHTHSYTRTIINSCLLLVLIISTFVFIFCPILHLFESDWICDFMTHCPCMCAMSLRHDMTHSHVLVLSVLSACMAQFSVCQRSGGTACLS